MPNPMLKTGCYLIRFTPTVPVEGVRHYDGVLRVTREYENGMLVPPAVWSDSDIIRASADLYQHYLDADHDPVGAPVFGTEESQRTDIPFFPRANYSFYLRGIEVANPPPEAEEEQFMIRFETYRYDRERHAFAQVGTRALVVEREKPDDMRGPARPPRDPDFAGFTRDNFFRGTLHDENTGLPVGTLQAGWVSYFLRKAQLEIDPVGSCTVPVDNQDKDEAGNVVSAGRDFIDWAKAFEQAGWSIDAGSPEGAAIEAPKEPWTLPELHQAMLLYRSTLDVDTDQSWHYYMLCVDSIDGYERGVSFDWGVDLDKVPDQIVALTAGWRFGAAAAQPPPWGGWQGKQIGTTGGYFRTAVHEFGHAAGLGHNHADNGFMNTTDVLAQKGLPPSAAPGTAAPAPVVTPFPDNIKWSFHPKDLARLRHAPDAAVRPDIIYGGQDLVEPDADKPAEGVTLHVRSLHASVPLGAPVRVEFRLENTTDDTIHVPDQPSLKSGHIVGVVVNPRGDHLPFNPVGQRLDNEAVSPLEPGAKSHTRSLTLLSGREGALFRIPGLHSVHVQISWHDAATGKDYQVWGMTRVNVTDAQDAQHRMAALSALGNRQTLLSLAIGGDHLVEGQRAIKAALDSPVLRAHYAIVESKRLIRPFRVYTIDRDRLEINFDHERPEEVLKALDLIQPSTVLTIDEIERLAELMNEIGGPDDRQPFQPEFDRVATLLFDFLNHAIAQERISADHPAIELVLGLLPDDYVAKLASDRDGSVLCPPHGWTGRKPPRVLRPRTYQTT